ncbi:branched-chain amino acid ABC transporter permease [Halostagnicola sp. A-GB9-2]|uniref:branched-chain amino acid ABC transporter permease n=1 Tax=Halostagnicola sp. A-GB9-2 TaxID=3048066 RepID=UPI0024BFAB5F|nr:branched-chain amino acid ABC transporter permease [Halostagnicola sp. A-GB9-2]MDJ1434759.1 branched-chain amino acid ABC transporter permease [Halostagnicola sp. A-GB9-2]
MIESALSFLFLTLSVAAVYILVATGLSITMGTLDFANMTHAALYLFGAYIALVIIGKPEVGGVLESAGFSTFGLGWGLVPAIILTPIIVFGIGLVLEKYVVRPLSDRNVVDQILITFGLLFMAQELMAILFGTGGQTISRPGWASGPLALPGIGTVSRWRFYVILITVILMGALLLFYKRTDFGLVVRGATQDAQMVQLLGIKVNRPYAFVFGIGAAYAGIAGLLGGTIFAINHELGVEILIPALLVVVAGGMGSIKGTIVAGTLFGLAWATANSVYPQGMEASIYLVAIVIIMLWPEGLFGSTGVEM